MASLKRAKRSSKSVRGNVLVHREGDPPFLKRSVTTVYGPMALRAAQLKAEKQYEQSTFGMSCLHPRMHDLYSQSMSYSIQ